VNLLLHDLTRSAAENFLNNPVHGVLIEGKDGSGKLTLGRYISSRLLSTQMPKLGNHAYYLELMPTKGIIPIGDIRGIQQFMRLKTIGTGSIRRVLLVNQAEVMTKEAQNAFLKILEEPPTDTVIILTSANPQILLPTIRSRVQKIRVESLGHAEIQAYLLQDGHKQADIDKAYYVAEGHIGLMQALLSDDNHQLLSSIDAAKEILLLNSFERLARVDVLSKQKDSLVGLLQALQLVCHVALSKASEKNSAKDMKRWHHMLRLANQAEQNYQANPHTKLLLTDLLLNL
jgi:DNA polymerase-3 subunit delta'